VLVAAVEGLGVPESDPGIPLVAPTRIDLVDHPSWTSSGEGPIPAPGNLRGAAPQRHSVDRDVALIDREAHRPLIESITVDAVLQRGSHGPVGARSGRVEVLVH
jgi:hypothetical protein